MRLLLDVSSPVISFTSGSSTLDNFNTYRYVRTAIADPVKGPAQ